MLGQQSAAVGDHGEACVQRVRGIILTIADDGIVSLSVQCSDIRAVDGLCRTVPQDASQCVLQCRIGQHVAEFGYVHFFCAQQGATETLLLRDVDGADGRYVWQFVPYAQPIQQQSAAVGQGEGAGIRAGCVGGARFQHADFQLAALQGQRQRAADRAAADDGDVVTGIIHVA